MVGLKLKSKNKLNMRDQLEQATVGLAMPEPTQMVEMKEYRPSNNEALREYEIRIRFLNRGCVVNVGCKEIAFESVEKAMEEINNYVTNPYDQQQKWRKILD
jgi:hypothetical protein